jgi:hypothetical protein
MTHLPQHPSDEVATKADLNGLEEHGDARFDRMEDRIDQLAIEVREMNCVTRDQPRAYSLGTIGAMTALTAIFSLVVTFLA